MRFNPKIDQITDTENESSCDTIDYVSNSKYKSKKIFDSFLFEKKSQNWDKKLINNFYLLNWLKKKK